MQLDGLQHLHGVFFRHLHADVFEPHVDRVDAWVTTYFMAGLRACPAGALAKAGPCGLRLGLFIGDRKCNPREQACGPAIYKLEPSPIPFHYGMRNR